MKKTLLLFPLLLLFSFKLFAQEETRLLRFPSTNGNIIAFTYAGDLYSVPISGGVATKLTSHIGFEMFAHFSPDGKTIAFTGQYDGNTEVFSIPSEGGVPQRLTYTATLDRDDVSDRMGPNNIVMAWTPDGKEIVYRSRKQTFGFRAHLFKVSKNGGLSSQVPLPEGGFCSFSADGKKLAYNRVFREFRTWKYYQGGMADDIWIHDFDKHQTKNVTNNKAQDIIPMWIDDEIFFLSDRDRTMNLFVYNVKTEKTEKVTNFTEFDIKFPTNSKDFIVFENGGYIYKLDVKSRNLEKVTIKIAGDFNDSRRELSKNVSKNITDIGMSFNAERLIISARGEIFDAPVVDGTTRNITNTSGAHERSGSWSPDGRWIAYISDVTGETELYIQSANGSNTIQLTKNNDTYILNFAWSPDSKKILYADRKNRLQYVDIATKQTTLVIAYDRGGTEGLSWSPDSKWITYSLTEANDMRVVYLYNIADKKQYPVTDKWYSSYGASFSSDGKYLYFSSARDFNPTYSSTEWNHVYNNMNKVYLAILSKNTPSPFETKNDEVKINGEPKSTEKSKDKEEKTEDKSLSDIKIDIDGLQNRILSLPIEASNYRQIIGVGNKVYYVRGGVKMFDLSTQKETDIADDRIYDISPNGKKMLLMSGEKIAIVDLPSSKVKIDKTVDLSGLKVNVNYREEWAQIFDESWRHMRDGFYVTNMQGVDWKAMKKKYAALLPYVNHRADLTYIIGEMIGELNVGHAYVNSGDMPSPLRLKTGLLGAKISADKSGYFRIDEILEGVNWSKELRSPLTEIGVNAKNGEYIIAIDGVSTKNVADLYQLLVDKADKKVEITLNSKPEEAGSRKAIVVPLATESQLYYYNWVQNNIRKVEKATNGRVGYIHIPDMGVPGLNEFAKYFYPQLDKEALIVDDRSNGGGNVSPMILERLARIPYRATAWRSSAYPGVIPNKTLVGPKTVLIDKYSMSDGDLFPYGFRELKLGKLIGMRTWGGIVGISGSLPFIDGADLRVPMFTSYSIETGQWVIEGYGVDPDIEIDNDPAKEWNDEDQQLNKAIEQMLLELKDRKPIPSIPAAPDRSGKK